MESRNRGKRGELELVSLLKDAGFAESKRVSNSIKNRTSDIVGLDGIHCEVQVRERIDIWSALNKSLVDSIAEGKGDAPVVFFKRPRSSWYVALPLNDFLNIYKGDVGE